MHNLWNGLLFFHSWGNLSFSGASPSIYNCQRLPEVSTSLSSPLKFQISLKPIDLKLVHQYNISYPNSSPTNTSDLIAPQTFAETKSKGLVNPEIVGLLNK